jgi:hypothetical protein
MVRKEAQQAYFKDKNIETVLGDLEGDVSPFYGLFDKVILLPVLVVQMLSELIKKRKLIDASKSIKKFVMLSSMGADKPEEATQLQEF